MTGSAGSLSPGERVGVRVFAYEPNSWRNHPLPRPRPAPGQALLPQSEGVRPANDEKCMNPVFPISFSLKRPFDVGKLRGNAISR